MLGSAGKRIEVVCGLKTALSLSHTLASVPQVSSSFQGSIVRLHISTSASHPLSTIIRQIIVAAPVSQGPRLAGPMPQKPPEGRRVNAEGRACGRTLLTGPARAGGPHARVLPAAARSQCGVKGAGNRSPARCVAPTHLLGHSISQGAAAHAHRRAAGVGPPATRPARRLLGQEADLLLHQELLGEDLLLDVDKQVLKDLCGRGESAASGAGEQGAWRSQHQNSKAQGAALPSTSRPPEKTF